MLSDVIGPNLTLGLRLGIDSLRVRSELGAGGGFRIAMSQQIGLCLVRNVLEIDVGYITGQI